MIDTEPHRLAVVHRVVGLTALVLFLASGAYLRFRDPPLSALEPGPHAMFTSRHIHVLAAALVNLALGLHLKPSAGRARRTLQIVGSTLLVLGALLVVAAFPHEAIRGHGRGPLSTFGLQALFGGVLLHFGSTLGRRAKS